jgi:hypothetical protein
MLPATTDYLTENQVPFFGWGFQPGYCDYPDGWGYGFTGCLIGSAVGVPDPVNNTSLVEPIGELLGNPDYTIAILNSDDDSGHGVAPQYQELYGDRLLSLDFVPTSGVTDYSPYYNEVLDSGADSALVACDFACTLAVMAALVNGGFEGPVWGYSTYIPGILSDPAVAGAIEGTYVNTSFPPQEGGGPAIEQMETDLTAIGEDPLITLGVSAGYWSADLFLQMLDAVGSDLTLERFHEVANQFAYAPPEGGLGPITFPDALQHPAPCAALVKIENGQYVLAQPYECYENVPAGT